MLWYIELKFCIWLCLIILQIKFDCRQFASIFVGVMPLLERKMMKYTVFRTFLLHALTYWAEILHICLAVLQIKFECRQLASIFVGVMPLSGLTGNTQLYTCIDKFRWNLKFHVGFFNAFLLCFRKVLYKNSPLKCSWRAYYAPFAVLRYIYIFWNFLSYMCYKFFKIGWKLIWLVLFQKMVELVGKFFSDLIFGW